jgi:hypothetical protein
LQYVDVPTKWVNEKADPDNYGQTPGKGFTFNTELDSSFTGPRKPLTEAKEGTPSGTETVEAKQAKAKKQKAPAAPVTQGVKVDVAAAAAATDPAEIQKHLADIETEGATLLSKDGRFPKKGTTKRTRLDELGQLKRQLTEKLAPAPVVE